VEHIICLLSRPIGYRAINNNGNKCRSSIDHPFSIKVLFHRQNFSYGQYQCLVANIGFLRCQLVSECLQIELNKFPGDFQEGFQEKFMTCLHCFGLLCNVPNLQHLVEHVMMSSNQHDMHTRVGGKDKKGRPVS